MISQSFPLILPCFRFSAEAAQKDINVIFPLTRFRELAQEGSIGALAEGNYSYHGLTNIPRLVQESAPQWAQVLKAFKCFFDGQIQRAI